MLVFGVKVSQKVSPFFMADLFCTLMCAAVQLLHAVSL
jgi:hypothetical protein